MGKSPGYIRKVRYGVQFGFVLLTLFIGYQFYRFVLQFQAGSHPLVQRPPSVDAFLPIAGLMSVKYFLFTGIVEPVHPAAFIMFVAIVSVSLVMKKGFCGWICPIGSLSQVLWMTGEKIFGRNFRIERSADNVLRSPKYLLMALFLVLIGIAMAPNMMVLFFITDYYKTADVRTMQFFTEMSTATMWVLVALGGLSLLYKNFWCRYLCPYGALLGLLSCGSPVKVRRDDRNCVHCRACSTSCPGLIDVEKKAVVSSPECFGCLTCVSSCPSPGALEVTLVSGKNRKVFKPLLYPLVLVALLYLIIAIGMVTGNWHSQLPIEEYGRLLQELVK